MMSWLVSALAVATVSSFQILPKQSTRGSALFSALSLERTATREVDYFQEYAVNCGVEPENGFCLTDDLIDGNEEWYATVGEPAAAGSRALFVPGGMIISAQNIAQEFTGYADEAASVVQQKYPDIIPQFYLFLKVLMEYELGEESPYAPWLAALPRKWHTAAAMDDFCLSCLPPYLLGLCKEEQAKVAVFKQALKAFEYVSPESKANDELIKFAYNVVFTRSFPTPDGSDYRLVPVADMINHGYPDNAALVFDEEENCSVMLKEDVSPGEPLTVSYGTPNNPSQLLATYGFLNEAPATFCKMTFSNPSQELINIGYDPERMLYDTSTGAIAQEVWDVLLFSRLERKPDLAHVKDAFYQACSTGDEDTKMAIHGEYQLETCNALLRHVNFILIEVHELTVKMNAFDSSKHPRLPLLKKHHAMVTTTFEKVRDYLDAMIGN